MTTAANLFAGLAEYLDSLRRQLERLEERYEIALERIHELEKHDKRHLSNTGDHHRQLHALTGEVNRLTDRVGMVEAKAAEPNFVTNLGNRVCLLEAVTSTHEEHFDRLDKLFVKRID